MPYSYKTEEAAENKAKKLIKKLGKKWKHQTFYNLGWFYDVTSPSGKVSIHESTDGKYYCMISTLYCAGSPGWYSCKKFKDPRDAVRESIKVAKKSLNRWQKIIDEGQELVNDFGE